MLYPCSCWVEDWIPWYLYDAETVLDAMKWQLSQSSVHPTTAYSKGNAPLAGCRRAVGASLRPTHQHAQAMQMYDSKANGLLRLLGIEGCVRYFWRPHRSGIPSVWEGEPESATAVWLFIFLSRLTTPGWKGEAIRIEARVRTFTNDGDGLFDKVSQGPHSQGAWFVLEPG